LVLLAEKQKENPCCKKNCRTYTQCFLTSKWRQGCQHGGRQGGQKPTLEKSGWALRVVDQHAAMTYQCRLNHKLILVAQSARPVDPDSVIEDCVYLNDQRKDDFGL